MKYVLEGKIWEYGGKSAWYFITLPSELTGELKAQRDPMSRGFGSIRVQAKIGLSLWSTSIFPDSKLDAFLLPVKKEVRIANNLHDGDIVDCEIELVL